jgi:hypothetical protein
MSFYYVSSFFDFIINKIQKINSMSIKNNVTFLHRLSKLIALSIVKKEILPYIFL